MLTTVLCLSIPLLCSLFLLHLFFPPIAPSPLPSRSRSSSVGESLGLGGGRAMRALVSHPSSSNPKLLPFNRGETVTVLVQEPRNGWLYGRTDSSLRWVAEIEDILYVYSMHAGAGATYEWFESFYMGIVTIYDRQQPEEIATDKSLARLRCFLAFTLLLVHLTVKSQQRWES